MIYDIFSDKMKSEGNEKKNQQITDYGMSEAQSKEEAKNENN